MRQEAGMDAHELSSALAGPPDVMSIGHSSTAPAARRREPRSRPGPMLEHLHVQPCEQRAHATVVVVRLADRIDSRVVGLPLGGQWGRNAIA
jgi:hypothetical protein